MLKIQEFVNIVDNLLMMKSSICLITVRCLYFVISVVGVSIFENLLIIFFSNASILMNFLNVNDVDEPINLQRLANMLGEICAKRSSDLTGRDASFVE